MSRQSVNGRSLELVDTSMAKEPDGSLLSPKPTLGGSSAIEIIDTPELARRTTLPASWIRSHTRRRTLDEVPHFRFGRYVRFAWNSPELQKWIASHREATR